MGSGTGDAQQGVWETLAVCSDPRHWLSQATAEHGLAVQFLGSPVSTNTAIYMKEPRRTMQ